MIPESIYVACGPANDARLILWLQLDDWVLCRIYEKCTHAQRAGKEHDRASVEDVLASLPEIDDPNHMLPRLNSMGMMESAQQQALVDSMLTKGPSDDGCSLSVSIDSLQRGMISSNPDVAAHELQTSTLTNEWKMQVSLDSTPNHLIGYDFQNELGSVSSAMRPTLNIRPSMAGSAMTHFQNPQRSSNNIGARMVARSMPVPPGRAASDEEVQSTLRSSTTRFGNGNEGLESMFPTMGNFDQQAQSTSPYTRNTMAYNLPYGHGSLGTFN